MLKELKAISETPAMIAKLIARNILWLRRDRVAEARLDWLDV
ncbi:MAG TPA: hypothetical protein VHC71_03850 [Hyphomicrobium sp.]|jgi:hypothetical protein|nr:hypothetical protein [Hyphomicrobium sp.]